MAGTSEERKSSRLLQRIASLISPQQRQLVQQAQAFSADLAGKLQALFAYLQLSDAEHLEFCLAKAGKTEEWFGWTKGAPKAPAVPTDTKSTERALAGQRPSAHSRAAVQMWREKLAANRQQAHAMDAQTVESALDEIFKRYSSKALFMETGCQEMAVQGWLRLLSDCMLLDNRTAPADADAVFGQAAHTDFEGFKQRLVQLAVHRAQYTSKRAQGTPEQMYQSLVRNQIIPLAADMESVLLVDGLFTREALDLQRQLDAPLRRLFGFYSNLGDAHQLTWLEVVNSNCIVDAPVFVLLMANFEVVPLLASRHEVLACFSAFKRPDGRGGVHEPRDVMGLLHTLLALAAHIADNVQARITRLATPEEMQAFKRYARGCEDTALRTRLQEQIQAVEAQRHAAALGPYAVGYIAGEPEPADFFDRQGRINGALAAHGREQAKREWHLGVLGRREDARHKLALTRLRNYYADIRTTLAPPGSSSWPPRGQGGEGHHHHGGGGGPGGDGGLEHSGRRDIAFFAGDVQIKTPKFPPIHVPSLPLMSPGRSQTSPRVTSMGGPLETSPSAAFSQKRGSFNDGVDLHFLKERGAEIAVALTRTTYAPLTSSGHGLGTGQQLRGGGGGMHHHQLHVDLPIEVLDEYERMNEVTRHLPAISPGSTCSSPLPRGGGRGGGSMQPALGPNAPSGAVGAEASWNTAVSGSLVSQSSQRKVAPMPSAKLGKAAVQQQLQQQQHGHAHGHGQGQGQGVAAGGSSPHQHTHHQQQGQHHQHQHHQHHRVSGLSPSSTARSLQSAGALFPGLEEPLPLTTELAQLDDFEARHTACSPVGGSVSPALINQPWGARSHHHSRSPAPSSSHRHQRQQQQQQHRSPGSTAQTEASPVDLMWPVC